MALTLRSPAFQNGCDIPEKYTCQGQNVSPPLSWSGVPKAAKSLVLIVDDPDAPDPRAPKMIWVHWLVYNLPPSIMLLEEGANLPCNTEMGLNDWKHTKYDGPCPPIGRHRYFHKLYALDTVLDGLIKPSKADIEKAMQGHILDQAQLVGIYQK